MTFIQILDRVVQGIYQFLMDTPEGKAIMADILAYLDGLIVPPPPPPPPQGAAQRYVSPQVTSTPVEQPYVPPTVPPKATK